jgi:tRNA threonylcarbamoyladenosine biosynthesis protein TsaE
MTFHFSLEEINALAFQFWNYVNGAKVFAFHGQMGAGKTTIIEALCKSTIIEALCKSKGVKDAMGSPTFSIINEYVYMENDQERIIYHVDLYRLKDEQEIVQAGVEDCIYSNELCFVEWPEKAPHLVDENTVHVFITLVNEDERNVKIELPLHSMKEQS